MATKAYFRHFPIIEYGTKIARNIIARPRLKESILNNPLAFYKYVVENDFRPDQVASNYYDDPEMVWLVFLANDIVDPYHQWPLTNSQFNESMKAKYGSLETARSKILTSTKSYRSWIVILTCGQALTCMVLLAVGCLQAVNLICNNCLGIIQ